MSDDIKITVSPSPVGYWVMPGGSEIWQTKFSAYTKPHMIHRFFMHRLLGWKWEDA